MSLVTNPFRWRPPGAILLFLKLRQLISSHSRKTSLNEEELAIVSPDRMPCHAMPCHAMPCHARQRWRRCSDRMQTRSDHEVRRASTAVRSDRFDNMWDAQFNSGGQSLWALGLTTSCRSTLFCSVSSVCTIMYTYNTCTVSACTAWFLIARTCTRGRV